MRFRLALMLTFVWCAGALSPCSALGQETLPRIGVGVKISTLGIGIEAATAVTQRSNLRGGFNFFNYNDAADQDGIRYDASLTLRSVQVTYDQYILGGFHVSPGLLVYNGSSVQASASVPAGRSFSLADVRYFSNQANPITGNATLKVRRAAPMVLLGFGNLLPRSQRHFGVNVDFGVVFQGSPDVSLNLTGSACVVNPTAGCVNAATDPIVQSNIQREQDKTRDDLQPLKYYPVVSVGLSWKF
jgi:hypothetical protein